MTSLLQAHDGLRRRAAWLRGLPDALDRAWRSSGWTGSAAEALRAELDRIGAEILASADLHERAAEALSRLMTNSTGGGGGRSW